MFGRPLRWPVAAPLLVVDTPSLLFRAFYALPSSIKGPDGKPVNALLGTANLILREVGGTARARWSCALALTPRPTGQLYPAYHADREAAFPDDLGPQWEDAGDFFSAFGWTIAETDS